MFSSYGFGNIHNRVNKGESAEGSGGLVILLSFIYLLRVMLLFAA